MSQRVYHGYMAEKRTKKNKIDAQVRRELNLELYLQNSDQSKSRLSINLPKSRAKINHQPLTLAYDTSLIVIDLKRTVIISALIIAIEVILNQYVR